MHRLSGMTFPLPSVVLAVADCMDHTGVGLMPLCGRLGWCLLLCGPGLRESRTVFAWRVDNGLLSSSLRDVCMALPFVVVW